MTRVAKDIDNAKVNSDINFLKSFLEFAKANKWRLVVYGGYGLDGYLGVITRSHGDLDIVIYGQDNRQTAEGLLRAYLDSALQKLELTVKQEPFFLELDVKATNFGANLYYVETIEDPHQNLHKVRRQDGEVVVNNAKDFPPPVTGKLKDLAVEVQDQNAHLADILRRRGYDVAHNKHNQDLANIREALKQ